jgi:hypothetical protein
MAVLVPCPSCARHIATTEPSCPFCASALPTDLESRTIPGATRRLSRFAMFTFATTATAVGALAACSSSSSLIAPYGIPPQEDGSVNDAGGAQPLYGLADASFIDDTGSPDDAAITDSGEDAD